MACTGKVSNGPGGKINITDVIAKDETFYSWMIVQTKIADMAAFTTTSSSTSANIDTAFTAITNSNADLTAVKTCLTTTTPTTATTQAGLLSKIDKAQKNLVKLNNDIQVAQDRALLVRHPELSRSYYEGILPIARPIKPSSIPVLIGVSMFLFSISFFMLLSIMNIRMETVLTLPAFMTGSSEYRQFGKPFFTLLGISIILFALTIYAFTRKA